MCLKWSQSRQPDNSQIHGRHECKVGQKWQGAGHDMKAKPQYLYLISAFTPMEEKVPSSSCHGGCRVRGCVRGTVLAGFQVLVLVLVH